MFILYLSIGVVFCEQSPLSNASKSPYFKLHEKDLVQWYSWDDAVLARAVQENKMIFLSIGYSSCHWCHVMSHESFQDPEIANMLNQNFICILVDREERPDIDQIYLQAVQFMLGTAGWPLNVFLTPDLKPFYAGMYFPPRDDQQQTGFLTILQQIAMAWKTNPEDILSSGLDLDHMFQWQHSTSGAGDKYSSLLVKTAVEHLLQKFDNQYGGFGFGVKFPNIPALSLLMWHWYVSKSDESLSIVIQSLDAMAKGGIHDHLGGGFHRYSVDRQWIVPHFEKMLYDQALIGKIYLEAYQITHKKKYKQVVLALFNYVLNQLRDPKGAFYSSQGTSSMAKVDLESGAFYLWQKSQILDKLGLEDGEIFCAYYGIVDKGASSSAGQNVLHKTNSIKELSLQFKKHKEDLKSILQMSRQKLLNARSQRVLPDIDDKILVDWNGLMISSLALASRVLDDSRYQEAAAQAAQWILANLQDQEGRLYHCYYQGKKYIPGFLSDYAYFSLALIDLYEVTGRVQFLQEALKLSQVMVQLFWDGSAQRFVFVQKDSKFSNLRFKDIEEIDKPSAMAVAGLVCWKLNRLIDAVDLESKAKQSIQSALREFHDEPENHAYLLMILDWLNLPSSREIVIIGDKANPQTHILWNTLYESYLPNKVVVVYDPRDTSFQKTIELMPWLEFYETTSHQPVVYICSNRCCQLPIYDQATLKKNLR